MAFFFQRKEVTKIKKISLCLVAVFLLMLSFVPSVYAFSVPFFEVFPGSQLDHDAIVSGWNEANQPFLDLDLSANGKLVSPEAFRPYLADYDGFYTWYAGCGSNPVFAVLYEICKYQDGKIYRSFALAFASNMFLRKVMLASNRYYFGGYMGYAGRRYTQTAKNTGEAHIVIRTENSYDDACYTALQGNTLIAGIYKLDVYGSQSLFDGAYPYGKDPPPLTGDILYPQGYRGWDYLRNFGADALPAYEDLQRFLYYFSNPPSANDTVVNYFYLVLRSKTTSKYQVHILGRDIYEDYSQQAGILLKWKKSRLFGLLGGYYQANNNPSIPTTGVVNPGRSQWIGPGRSCWFLEVSRFGSVYPYKVNNKFDVIEFGCFVPDHEEQIPPVLNPPESLPPEYDPEAQIEPPQALSAIEEALIALFVPRSFSELDVMDMLGDVTLPVSDFLGIFKDVAEFDPKTNAPDVFYNGVNVLSPLAEIMDTPVSLFGYNGSLISVVRKLNTVNLGLIMAYSFYRLGRRVFGGGGAE